MDQPAAPARTIGFWGASLYPVNGMVGAGIFAVPALLAAAVGGFAPWLMLVGGILFMPIALVYAWLATRFSHSGGPVLYGEAAFGRFVGFQAGWGRYASNIVTAAANTQVMVAYAAALIPALNNPAAQEIATIASLVLFMVINLVGLRFAAGTLGVMTAIKLLPLGALVVAAFFAGDPSAAFAVPKFTLGENVILLTYYAFIGFESVAEAAGEVRNPKRVIPVALVTMVSAVTLLYMAVIWAYVAMMPQLTGGTSDNALVDAGRAAMGHIGGIALVVAAVFSIGANTFSGNTTLPRLAFGMGERRMLPRWFTHVSPRFGTPDYAILFTGIAAIAFGLWEGFAVLAVAGTLVRLVTYLICSAALPMLELRDGTLRPFHSAMAIAAFAGSLWVSSFAEIEAWEAFAAIFACGTLLYFIAARQEPEPVLTEQG
ncbi:MAG: APC family permease [Sphingomonadaceae bacterium]